MKTAALMDQGQDTNLSAAAKIAGDYFYSPFIFSRNSTPTIVSASINVYLLVFGILEFKKIVAIISSGDR